MRVRGPNNVGRVVQTDTTLLRYASLTWNKRNDGSRGLKSLTGFKLRATTPNNTPQHSTECVNGRNTWHPKTNNNVASFYTWPKK